MTPAFRTIKALVFDYIRRNHGHVKYEALTQQVLTHFPASAWKKTHWAWYRYQIVRGRFRSQFSEEERRNLGPCPSKTQTGAALGRTAPGGQHGPAPRDPKVKEAGDRILKNARATMERAAKDDQDFYFRINRWVFSRMQQKEVRAKRPIKRRLWESGQRACQACRQPFKSLKGVEIHRKQSHLGYSVENCELLCRECHQEIMDIR